MAYYSLNTTPPTTATTLLAARGRTSSTHLTTVSYIQRVQACHQASDIVSHDGNTVQRRNVSLALAGVVLSCSVFGEGSANAAARRPPPSPTEEKKDPNVSGVRAKVLASKRRKEAMKEAVSKLKEKGKPIQEPSQ